MKPIHLTTSGLASLVAAAVALYQWPACPPFLLLCTALGGLARFVVGACQLDRDSRPNKCESNKAIKSPAINVMTETKRCLWKQEGDQWIKFYEERERREQDEIDAAREEGLY